MFKSLNVKALIYIDIETVPMERNYESLPLRIQTVFKKKAEGICKRNGEEFDESKLNEYWQDNAALYPEYGKIVSIAIGAFNNAGIFGVKAINWKTDEAALLQEFYDMLEESYFHSKNLIAHNGINFDFPWLTKRYIINGMKIPVKLWSLGKKPWELQYKDSQEIWKFGSYGSTQTASLDLISAVFGLPSPKAEMHGADVWKHFYNEDGTVNPEGVEEVGHYCCNDVVSMAQVMAMMTGQNQEEAFQMPEFI